MMIKHQIRKMMLNKVQCDYLGCWKYRLNFKSRKKQVILPLIKYIY